MARKKSDSRVSRQSSSRSTRASKDREATGDRNLSDSERLDEFRKKHFQSVLPTIPHIPGYHVCWLTTQNPRDPIPGRLRLGYEPITSDDIPGWGDYAAIKSGEWEGCFGINEMIAMKLPMHLYEAYMTENHHIQPGYEEEKLSVARQEAEQEASQLARKPISFELEDGQAELGSGPEPLTPFAETLGEMEPE